MRKKGSRGRPVGRSLGEGEWPRLVLPHLFRLPRQFFHPSSAATGDSLVGCGEKPAHVEDRVQRIERH